MAVQYAGCTWVRLVTWKKMRRLVLAVTILANLSSGQEVDVLTSHYDKERTGANLHESILNTSNVTPDRFGKLFAADVDGQVYAQPLYVSSIDISGVGVRDVVYAATMHNSVYAIDAVTGSVLWQTSLGPSVPASNYNCARDVQDEIGILSTPVIDRDRNAIFAVAATIENGNYKYRLHALDLTSGQPILASPREITAPGFDPFSHWQRPGLLLYRGAVYVGFGSHCDAGTWHGWLMSYGATEGLPQNPGFLVTRNGSGSSIWQSGRGPAADDFGHIFVVTGNGDFDGVANFGESVIRLSAQNTLLVQDWFTPDSWSVLNEADNDLGTSGVILVPSTNFVLTGSKDGRLFLLNQSNLGHFSTGDVQARQVFSAIHGFGIFTTAIWSRGKDSVVYLQGNKDVVKAFLLGPDGFAGLPLSQGSTTSTPPFQGMAISANGADPNSAILWVNSPDDALHAYSAADLTFELWNSDMLYDRDGLGSFVRFAPPTVANGRVFVPTASAQIVAYGLLPPSQPEREILKRPTPTRPPSRRSASPPYPAAGQPR